MANLWQRSITKVNFSTKFIFFKKGSQQKLSVYPKKLGGKFNSPCGFLKTLFCRERLKPCFFFTFDFTIRNIFSKNFIEIPQVVRKIWRFSSSISIIFITFWIIWHFLDANKLMISASDRWCQHLFYLQPTLNRLFKNCTKLKWYWISSSRNIKGIVKLTPIRKNYLQKTQPY